jgi:hypothetical protein
MRVDQPRRSHLQNKSDGVTRRVQRLGPPDEHDQHGKLAEDALIEALAERRPPSGAPDAISLDTPVMALVDAHIARLADDGRSPVTLSTYQFASRYLGLSWSVYDCSRLGTADRFVLTGNSPSCPVFPIAV